MRAKNTKKKSSFIKHYSFISLYSLDCKVIGMHAEAVTIDSSENDTAYAFACMQKLSPLRALRTSSENKGAHLRVPCDLHRAASIPLPNMLN
jgi:hypothetical protein